MSVGTSAEATLDPVTKSMMYVVANTQIRYIMVLTKLRVAVSYIIQYICERVLGGRIFGAQKNLSQYLQFSWGCIIVVILRLGSAYIKQSLEVEM